MRKFLISLWLIAAPAVAQDYVLTDGSNFFWYAGSTNQISLNSEIGGGGAGTTNLFAGVGTTGLVTSTHGESNKFLRGDGTWQGSTTTEYDPIFTNWVATNVITEHDPVFTNWAATNVITEYDPIFTNWVATNVITEYDPIFTNWQSQTWVPFYTNEWAQHTNEWQSFSNQVWSYFYTNEWAGFLTDWTTFTNNYRALTGGLYRAYSPTDIDFNVYPKYGGTATHDVVGWTVGGALYGTNTVTTNAYLLEPDNGARLGPFAALVQETSNTQEWENIIYRVEGGESYLMAPGVWTQSANQVDFAVTNDITTLAIRLDPSSGASSPSEQWYNNEWYGFAFIGTSDKEMLASARIPEDADTEGEFFLEFSWVESKTGSDTSVVFKVETKFITVQTNQNVSISWMGTNFVTNTAQNVLGRSHEDLIDIANTNILSGDRLMIRFTRDTSVLGNWGGTANVGKNTELRYRKKR